MRSYNATFHITEKELVKILEQQLPALKVNAIHKIGEGWDNYVYEINSAYIFRVPRRKVAIKLLETEQHVMPTLASHLNLPVSAPIYYLKPSKLFPYLILGYKKIDGVSGDAFDYTMSDYKRIARTLGQFLKTLHNLDAKMMGLEKLLPNSVRGEQQQMCNTLQERWRDLQTQASWSQYQNKIDAILANVNTDFLSEGKSCIVHGDLYSRHLIIDDAINLTGIIDWGDVSYSHFVIDLMVVYQFLPTEAHEYFFAEYGNVSADILDYAKFLGLYSAIALLWYGSDMNDKNLLKTAEKTLLFL
jgi:aminoglycoside phosphotransferase (APT) family kinase protein